MSPPDRAEDDAALTRRALSALLEIAWDGNPEEVVSALRQQAQDLSEDECGHMLQGFVDPSTLERLLEQAQAGKVEEPYAPNLAEREAAMVDAALEPLVQLVRPDAHESVQRLDPAQRAHLLFSAVHRRG